MHKHCPPIAALPLIPGRPRLRFIDGAPEGAAGKAANQDDSVTVDAEPVQQAAAATKQEPKLGDDPYIRKLRDENAERRIALDAANEALAKAQKERDDALKLIADRDAEAKAKATTDKVTALAGELNAKATLLLDSATFTQKLSQVDPGDDAAIKTLIEETLEANPDYKTVQVPSSSGSLTPHQGGSTPPTATSLNNAVAQALTQKG